MSNAFVWDIYVYICDTSIDDIQSPITSLGTPVQ